MFLSLARVFFLLSVVVSLCSCDSESSCSASDISIQELEAQLTECRENCDNLKGAERETEEDTAWIRTFAFGVTVGVFSTLTAIVITVCCCVFYDKRN